jgi:magnesium chelatase family protein
MGLAILRSRAQIGVEAPPVTIEVFLSGGLPKFNIVGLAETAVRESKDRVFGAIKNSGFDFPQERITANLGPADMKKTGGRFDLPIALGILAASRQLPVRFLAGFEFYGELALNGDLRPVPGILPAAIKAAQLDRPIVVPRANGMEGSLAEGRVHVAGSLLEVTELLRNGGEPLPAARVDATPGTSAAGDLSDVRGQARARRALEVAAAGGHNLLFIGPPGTGKSMLAQRLPGLLPPLASPEALETAAVNSVLGLPLVLEHFHRRPFRAPHHTASAAALIGGGQEPRPGEVSRAHNGVLFLDELAEFNRHVLEVLREPLESGRITISRALGQADFPAKFQLVTAMNPCPCGYSGDRRGDCRCSVEAVRRYRGKISGPLLDRIDIHVEVARPAPELLRPDAPASESSAAVAARVAVARNRQLERCGRINAELTGDLLDRYLDAEPECFRLLERATATLAFSARAYQRVQRVGRTIADLAGETRVLPEHVAEALALRHLDRTSK